MNTVHNQTAAVRKKAGPISYAKWGYIFLIPFFLVYVVFSFVPLVSVFYNSFFENYMSGLTQIGPNFVGFENYGKLFENNLGKYFGNTMLIWVLGFIPQILISLLLASWFTNLRLRLRATGIFKTIIYLPNLIMASAFALLFFVLFSDAGPMNDILLSLGILETPYRFLSEVAGTRGLIIAMNFLLWFGNTTILLMAGIMGIDTSLIEAAEMDGAKPAQVFWLITMPLLKPIFVYVLITSLIGGLQMFDVPQILTNGGGNPDRTSTTLIMLLNNHLYSKNYGMGGALSVILLIVSGVLSFLVYDTLTKEQRMHRKEQRQYRKEQKQIGGGGEQ
ncbi:carbohydrate ABC transporter permease [Sinanaerobacter chloroacetimidivorans]|uniref:Sugar ABC transporter permease n=1 Tax=Sinanaerobacter chloroacetimidivorans TaxID=2818044 RepID=A0A8J8B304_9FIRM|nr:sugar ABC transporter permease [Sinanaerobacter chloroacetimidivorans]MBR0599859.1 sugar ABC transporter permease [Sinanaerobacter chloroacetimidivorans]